MSTTLRAKFLKEASKIERHPFHTLGMIPNRESVWRKVGLPTKLYDALGDLIGMQLFIEGSEASSRVMAKDIQRLPELVQYHHTAHEAQGTLYA